MREEDDGGKVAGVLAGEAVWGSEGFVEFDDIVGASLVLEAADECGDLEGSGEAGESGGRGFDVFVEEVVDLMALRSQHVAAAEHGTGHAAGAAERDVGHAEDFHAATWERSGPLADPEMGRDAGKSSREPVERGICLWVDEHFTGGTAEEDIQAVENVTPENAFIASKVSLKAAWMILPINVHPDSEPERCR
jgi:hypothetical protein